MVLYLKKSGEVGELESTPQLERILEHWFRGTTSTPKKKKKRRKKKRNG